MAAATLTAMVTAQIIICMAIKTEERYKHIPNLTLIQVAEEKINILVKNIKNGNFNGKVALIDEF